MYANDVVFYNKVTQQRLCIERSQLVDTLFSISKYCCNSFYNTKNSIVSLTPYSKIGLGTMTSTCFVLPTDFLLTSLDIATKCCHNLRLGL